MEKVLVIKQITEMVKSTLKKRFSTLLICLTLAFTGFIPDVATAQFTSVTNETLVNTTTAGEQWAYFWSVRTVAVQPDGGYISIWIDNNGLDGSGQGIFGQRFSASGAKVGGQFLVNTTTTGDQFSPSVAVAPNGSFLVAWEGPGTSTDVFGQFFSKTGAKIGTEFLLSTIVIGGQTSPEVQYYPDGTFVAGYVDGGQSVLQKFDAEGRTLGLETRINSGTGNVVLDAIAIRPDNSLVMTWESGGDVYGQCFSSTLQPIGSQIRLNTYTAGTQEYAVCRADALGNFVVVWQSHGQDGSGIGIYGRRYDNNFNPLSGEFAVTTNTTNDQIEPQIAMEPSGRFIIAWTDFNNRDAGGPDNTSVWIREFNNSGVPVGVETRVNQSVTGYQAYPVIDMNASGRIALDWEANGTQPGQIDNYGVFTRTYQLTQTGTTSISVVPTNGTASDIVTVTMTLTNPTSIANVKPNPLSVSGTNDVFATLVSGPTPASATVGTSPVTFTWTYRLTANGSAGSLTFGGNAHSSGGAIFPYSTSNSITVKPALYLSDITAPNLIGDQNVESHPEQGPRVFTIGAKITNAGLTPLTEVKLYLGDGVTPGVFPVTTMTLAQTNNTYQGSFSLIPLGGAADCSRSFISLAPSKSIIAGGIDFNGDNVVNASDDGVLGNGKTVIDGRVDANLSGTITTIDDIPAPPGVFTGYREPPVIDGYVDVNRDGIINASDAGTYGGEIKNVYWQVNYKVLDASGKATWGQTSDYADDLRYRWTIWTSAKEGAAIRTDMVNDYAKVRSEISALANKITPNPDGYISGGPSRVIAGQVDVNSDGVINSADDGFFYAKPVIDGKVDMNNSGTITTADDGLLIGFPVIDGFIDVNNSSTITSADDGLLVQPGQTFSITVHNAEFGTIGAGFDENRDNLWDVDFWYQPIGEVNWPSGSFRLIDIQADITGHGGNNPLNNITTHYSNEPYLSRLFNDNNGESGGFNGTYTYTFQALAPANGVLSPYQEAASGTNNEKYNGDYGVGINIYVGGLLCLGDRVWKDDNGNGIQDAGEPGLAGVTITLLNATGQIVASTTTDAFGNYKFCSLIPGDYSLRITPPANYSLSAKTQGGDVNIDSDFDPVSYTTAIISLYPNQGRNDIDAGLKFTQPSTTSIGDRVWLDTNGDGVQDAGEPGVSNVLVTLYNSAGTPVRSTYTDVNGNYLFTDVTPGTYSIGVSLPPAFIFSPNNGAISGATNSDIIPATGRTASFTVNAADQITYVDAGLKTQSSANGTIGDFVWNDLNKNGIQESGEQGIAGVTVKLVNATTNTIITTTTTDATGKYIFNNVSAGNYKVEFVTPAGYTVTTKLSTDPLSSNTDSDVEAATSRTATFALATGQRISTVDAGYWLTTPPGTGKIGNRVWLDANQNGIQDAGEANVQGMTVTLYDAANTAIKLAVTDANGNYLFTDLAAGNYTVGFSNVPAGFTFTTTGAGTAATGSDANPATGRTATIVLTAGQTNLDVDAGIRSAMAGTASIGNKVWYDLNNNGLQDAGELGIQAITVELLDAAGNPIDKDPVTPGVQPTITVTNALGEYLFTGLPAGDYKVRFSTLPAGYNAAPKGAGTDRTLDSDGNPVSGGSSTTDVFSLAAGDERLDIDLGLFNPTAALGQVGDRVWFDANNNGVQDAGEQGVPGVSVSLVNETGAVIATTVTNGDGIYKFVNVPDAVYWVQFSNLPSGFNFSGMDLGGNDDTDNDADPVTGKTATFFVIGGAPNMTIDAGIYSTRAALGDYVWFDADNDGTQDAGEKGIAGITVSLYDAGNNTVTSTITDQNGRYFFSNLNPGTYTVGFGTIPPQLVFTIKDAVVAGDLTDSDVDPATGKTGPVTLTAGQVNLTVDAGLKPYLPATIGDFVWFDLDKDGIQDANEPGIAGVIVTLYNSANQPIGSAITNGNGFYQISNVAPGTGYYLKFSNQPNPSASIWTLQHVGGAAANNNSKVDATGQTAAFNVTEGQNISNADAGLYKIINIRGNVWHDANGLTDFQINRTGAQPIPNSLNIYLVDVNTNQIVQFESINPDGTYSFLDVDINHSYKIVLSTVVAFPGSPSPVPFMPQGWIRVGENLGSGPFSGSDGLPDGTLYIDTETNDVIEANFGIRLRTGEVVIG